MRWRKKTRVNVPVSLNKSPPFQILGIKFAARRPQHQHHLTPVSSSTTITIRMSARSSLSGDRSAVVRVPLIVSLENPVGDPAEGTTSFQTIRVGCGHEWIDIELHRTLRLPLDDHVRTVPAGFGPFPLYVSDQFADKLPSSVNGGAFLPIYRKALFLGSFSCTAVNSCRTGWLTKMV